MTEAYIRAEHITKQYDKEPVLKDLNAVLQKGEILGFLGPSGAGKTTTIKILTGQLKPTSGDAYLLGIHVKNMDETIYEQIGIVTDQSGVYERLSVYENLKYFARILRVDAGEIDGLLQRVGLLEHKKKAAGKLSKGQMQRLVLARAVLHKPRILFLDEPTSGLDPSTALEIHRMLTELKNEGMAIFLTTHNMEEAAKLCDHVALLNDGQIVEYGTPKELCLRYNRDKRYRVLLESGEELVLAQTQENVDRLSELMKSNQVAALHSCEPTLESVFLTVTGRKLQ
ncbi:MAG: ABC transporter ATP-binding protein [Eubacterium sp.]|jgi:ABC-type multidrug transport system, ATPase component|nr:ABC transporter ATP-binding protein [Eubacterium sp.]